MTARTGNSDPATGPSPTADRELAWRLYSNAEAAAARADVKASIILAFQGSALVLVATSRIVAIGPAQHLPNAAITVVMLMLLGAIAAGVAAIAPTLGSLRGHRHDYPRHYVYFGHLRYWDPVALAARLPRTDPAEEIGMLAPQLITISRLTWRKHRLVQLSVVVTFVALSTLTLVVTTTHA
jgi:hypothetical protein